ncbi:M23 family metallopeptidase [Thalassobaculum litoreum]|uniref:Peptidase family M23 n=1 Tax=Thalassobaculum litoreum DSM 18839 TaxID=1123362 RepID=A0A8G2F3P5_9PROT|nr:M23 family metallopeptidase [Thalassobaculum litoreum]SDF94514.1 Peptidase family M23 [Thalassobaculum litoreum DSM 18839]
MIFRAALALIFCAALASFAYAFWLVLSPEGHNWSVDIPVERRLPTDQDQSAAPAPAPAASEPAASPSSESSSSAASPPRQPESSAAESTAAESTAAQPSPAVPPVEGERPITLSLPIACQPGVDCWVVNYVDIDPGPGREDYRCGEMSYDGHKGTDIGLANDSRIAEDIPVLAAAAGKVIGTRDGEEDLGSAGIEQAKAAGKECGNGVRIDHGNGWATQYCHMRKGSVIVRPGQEVAAGDALGAVGLSGMTQFPHIHLSVVRGDEVVDPFRGVVEGGEACGLGRQPLWDDQALASLHALRAPTLLDTGFFDRVPDSDTAAAGDADLDSLSPRAGAIVVWFRAVGVEPGDTADISLSAPDGTVVASQTVTFDKIQASIFRAIGLRNSAERFPDGLPLGEWTGDVVLRRDGRVTGERAVKVTVATTN